MLLDVNETLAVFGSRKIFSENAIFGKGKYFQVFGCIMKIVLENIFWCLVVFLKIIEKTHFLLDAHIFSHFLSFQTKPKLKKELLFQF